MKFHLRLGLLTTLLLSIVGSDLRGADVFVAVNGDDANPGTLEKPFATVQHAQSVVSAGDTVFIRGGTYVMKESQIAAREKAYAYITSLDKSGSRDKRINYFAYQNEKPVFDCSQVKPAGMRVDAFHVAGSWLHIKGLEVTGVQVTITGHTQSICFANDGSENIYEMLSMHDGQAIGIYSLKGANNLFLNCDAYRNYDYTSEDGRGGNVDGFGCHPSLGSTGNIFRGCRAWFNSDDGFDCINSHEAVTFDHCWAMYNGFSTQFESLGDGNGFKGGGYGGTLVNRLPNPIPRHVIRFCVSVGNKNFGFYSNHHIGGSDWFNNTAYGNAVNFNMLSRLSDNRSDVDGYGHRMRNNIGYNGKTEVLNLDQKKNDVANNYFNMEMQLSDKDFVSLDQAELVLPRQANGDLPMIGFMHPAAGSALIDMGVDLGFPFKGNRPALGAFEK